MLKTDKLPERAEDGFYSDEVYDTYFYDMHIVTERESAFGIEYVNAVYNFSEKYYYFVLDFGMDMVSVIKAIERNGKYEYVSEDTLYLDVLFLNIFLIATAATVITGGIIYGAKRKKQEYEF